MKKFFSISVLYFFLIVSSSILSFNVPQLNISINEFVNQKITYDPLLESSSDYNINWVNNHEEQTKYELSGEITFENVNYYTTNATFGDTFIYLNNTYNIISIDSLDSSNFAYINNDNIILYISRISPNETHVFNYTIDSSTVRPMINFSSDFSSNKILPGETFSIIDTIKNSFNFSNYQDNCIYNLEVIYEIVDSNEIDYHFNFSELINDDSSSANLINENRIEWLVNEGNCFDQTDESSIEYSINSPIDVPESKRYQFLNTSFSYNVESTISNMNVIDVKAKSEGINFNLSNNFYEFTYEDNAEDENITWEVVKNIYTDLENISFNVEEISLWVSESQNDLETDPTSVDTDSISDIPLYVNYNSTGMYFNDSVNHDCNIIDKLTNENTISNNNCFWYFNYTDSPSPILWMDFDYYLDINNYTLYNETGDTNSAQIQSHSLTTNESDYYLRQILVVIDYLLELEKNVTSIGNDTYRVEVWVKNRGNRWTPFDSPITIFDLVPNEFELLTDLSDYENESIYSDSFSNTYNTQFENFTISSAESYEGNMLKWSLGYTNNDYGYNSSLAAGHNTGWDDFDSTWYARYDVKGEGEYESDELYIIGLDPELVDGAGSNYFIELKSGVQSLENHEKFFLIAFLMSLGIMFLIIKKLKIFSSY